MPKLDKDTARRLLESTTGDAALLQHALAVSVAMGAMAAHFGAGRDYWEAVGLLHDYDYAEYPNDHLRHTEAPLREAGVDEESIRAILSHGWDRCTDVKPQSRMEQSLYAVDGLTGLISANARMRPGGISDLEPKSVMKKYKDKAFAAKIDREAIQKGADMLGMQLAEVAEICIGGMRPHAAALGLEGTGGQGG